MAETTTINQFGKGIALNCGFDLGAKSLMDSRCLVKDETELNAIPDIRRANGLLVWVQDTQKLMAWDEPNSKFVEVGVGGSVDITEIETKIEANTTKIESNTTQIETNTADITNIKNELTELSEKECVFDDTEDHIVSSAHGGLPTGTNVRGWKLSKLLDYILFPVKKPALKLSLEMYSTSDTENVVANSGTAAKHLYPIDYYNAKFTIAETAGDVAITYPATLSAFDSEISVEKNGTAEITNDANSSVYFGRYGAPASQGIQLKYGLATATTEEVTDTTSKEYSLSQIAIASNKIEVEIAPYTYVGTTSNFTPYKTDDTYKTWYTDNLLTPTGLQYAYQFLEQHANTAKLFDSTPVSRLMSEKTAKGVFNVAAFEEKRIFILSCRRIKTILNPSGFDVTKSFSGASKIVSSDYFSRTSAMTKCGFDPKIYFYWSEVNTQKADYPLTIEFETTYYWDYYQTSAFA